VEWHLHAWDLARAQGADYRPRDPELLVSAWHWGVPHLPLAVGDAWEAVLRSSGRSPTWPDVEGPAAAERGEDGARAASGPAAVAAAAATAAGRRRVRRRV
jgi:hypothetical protein